MDKKISNLKILILSFLLIFVTFTGCLEEEQKQKDPEIIQTSDIIIDQSSVIPDWKDGDYHDYYDTMEMINGLNEKYPDLVYVYSIGKSVLEKDIWCIRITNENNDDSKSSCLIDGCIHGTEWESGEACLYLAEYLLINFGTNTTITNILNKTEINIIPLLNPDGRQADERWNENGIDLNRNFDVDFGRFRGRCIRIGKLFGRIKIPYIDLPILGLYTNCGRFPFSEPESQAIKNLMERISFNDFSFYVNCHTAAHCVLIPWSVLKPPFEMTERESTLYDHVMNWVDENTEYEPNPVWIYMGKPVYMSGTITDWFYKKYRIPSFTFEILSEEYEMWMGKGKHDNLIHWMKTTLPFFMYLLVNIDNLRQWKTPDIEPPLPENVPPPPLK